MEFYESNYFLENDCVDKRTFSKILEMEEKKFNYFICKEYP